MISNYLVTELKRHVISRLRGFSTDTVSKPYYITAPLFYADARPHIGHLYSLIIADIFARHSRLRGNRVVFVTGTDEHGLKVQRAAEANVCKSYTWSTNISRVFYDLADKADVSFSNFVRTSAVKHTAAVLHLWNDLKSRGYIYKGEHSGWYSVSDECFYTESEITSSAHPETGESITVAKDTGSKVEWVEERNYIFALSKFRERLLHHFESNPDAIYPQDQHKLIIDKLRQPGSLPDLSISRPLSLVTCGLSVPDQHEQVIYVWLDALTSYLTALGYPYKDVNADRMEDAWPPDVQVIGKDILKFHAIYFHAFLMALELPLPKRVLSHSHWVVNGEKMSKSRDNTVDPFRVVEKYTPETVRWYFARAGGQFKDDIEWSNQEILRYESELQSTLGDFLSRIQATAALSHLPPYIYKIRLCGSVLSDNGGVRIRRPGNAVREKLIVLREKVDECMETFEVARALDAIVECLNVAQKEYQDCAPWVVGTPHDRVTRVLTWSRETLRICGILLQPFLPAKSAELLDALRVPSRERGWADARVGGGNGDSGPIMKFVLFPSLEERLRKKLDGDFEDVFKDMAARDETRISQRFWRHTLYRHENYQQRNKPLPVRHSNFLYKRFDEQITPPLVKSARPAPIAPVDE